MGRGPVRLGKYELLAPLGSGGMAEVWRAATHGAAGFNKEVALKLIRAEVASDARFVAMFVDEARISARLAHPNVVSTLDFGCVGERYFIALELIDGLPLAMLQRFMTRAERRWDEALASYVIAEVAAGLHYAHRACDQNGQPLNLVHRDVNPANIMISTHGEVKLADFGIAKASGRGTQTEAGALKGKVSYMSPEQAWAWTLDARSDVYALTLVLQELLTGRVALDGDGEIDVLNRARAADTAPLGDDLPPELARLIRRGLAFAPESRFASAAELRAALLPLLAPAAGRQLDVELARLVHDARPTVPPPMLPMPRHPQEPGATILTEAEAHASHDIPRAPRRSTPLLALGALLVAGTYEWRTTHKPQPGTAAPPAPSPRSPPSSPPPMPPRPPVDPAPAQAKLPSRTSPPGVSAHVRAVSANLPISRDEPAILRIHVEPWAEITLDGHPLGMTPLRPLDVLAGTHTIQMTHPQLGVRTLRITLQPGERRLIADDLRKGK
jgi:serine/threonine-protein kinase